MDYITIKQAAAKWGIGVRQVQNYCKNGDIEGVIRFNGVWAIPDSAFKPVSRRLKPAGGSLSMDPENINQMTDDPALWKQILDLFPYRINITDTKGFMVYGNDAFFEGTLPNVKDAAIGRYNILQEEFLEKWGLVEHIRKAFQGERVHTPGLRFPNRELVGSKYSEEYAFFSLYNDVSSFPIFTKEGRLRYVVTVFIPVRKYMARAEVIRAKEYIDAHWIEPFNTKQAAQAANLGITSFVQVFRNETGMTPHDYYTQSRMSRLRDTLKNSSLSISQAFNACGMDYNSYYTALFKRHVGMTPKQFRERNK